MARQYSEKYKLDGYGLNPSWDLYGGGGLASTTKDLAMFFQLLFEGQIIKDKALLKEMYTYVLPKEVSNYCLGIMYISFYKEFEAYYHGGFWGTNVMYIPELNATISAFTIHKDKQELNPEISYELVKLLKKSKKR